MIIRKMIVRAVLLLNISVAPFFSSLTWAGGGHSGGGDILICNEKGETKYYLADIYLEMISPWARLLRQRTSAKSVEELTRLFLDGVRAKSPELAQGLVRIFNTLKYKKFVPTEGTPHLPELNDDNIEIQFGDCMKRQLAIQNVKKKEVTYDPVLLATLSPIEQTLFEYHEAFIQLSQGKGPIYINKLLPDESSKLVGPINLAHSLVFNKGLKSTAPLRREISYLFYQTDFSEYLHYGDLRSDIAGRLLIGEKYRFTIASGIPSLVAFVFRNNPFPCPHPLQFISQNKRNGFGLCQWEGMVLPEDPLEIIFENDGRMDHFEINTVIGVRTYPGQVQYEISKLSPYGEVLSLVTRQYLPAPKFGLKGHGYRVDYFQPFSIYSWK